MTDWGPRQAIVDLMADYVHLLDDDRLEEWVDLFVEGDLLATPLATLLDLVCLWFAVRYLQDGERRRDLWAAGAALGLSALAGGLDYVLLPALLGFLALTVYALLRRNRATTAAGDE